MSRVIIIIIVGIVKLLFLVSSWIVIHLGRKPVSGGRPPIDRRVDDISGINQVSLFQVCDNIRIVVFEFRFRARNAVVVKTIYVRR